MEWTFIDRIGEWWAHQSGWWFMVTPPESDGAHDGLRADGQELTWWLQISDENCETDGDEFYLDSLEEAQRIAEQWLAEAMVTAQQA
jgi:hypothetical protein